MNEIFFPVGSRQKRASAVVPVFIPFAGCPHRCIFCAQDRQSGAGMRPVHQALLEAEQELLRRRERGEENLELAFYGGTFTALPEELFEQCLAFFLKVHSQNLVQCGRCSTRPDACLEKGAEPHPRLYRLKEAGISLVELGIQSFSDNALREAKRGYTAHTAEMACQAVQASGLELGIQLMPGMPGTDAEIFRRDTEKSLNFSPACIRFYPCLVPEGTELAEMWKRGQYRPWNTEQTVKNLGIALAEAWEKKIPVIRLSVAPENDFDKSLLDGPRHPCLGNLIQAEALFETVRRQLEQQRPEKNFRLFLPPACQGIFYGYKGAMRSRWEEIGVNKNIFFTIEINAHQKNSHTNESSYGKILF